VSGRATESLFVDLTTCQAGELDDQLVINFQNATVSEIIGSTFTSAIISKYYQTTSLGHFGDSVVVTDGGDMITIYEPSKEAPNIYQGVMQTAFLKQPTTTFISCVRMPE
jgi:hypothetical protein